MADSPQWPTAGSLTEFAPTFVYGDPRPDAPALAAPGPFPVGVRTVTVEAGLAGATGARRLPVDHLPVDHLPVDHLPVDHLPVEVWYPASLPPGGPRGTRYQDILGRGPATPDRPHIPFSFPGRATRGAPPNPVQAPYPLVIVSHGFPGSRFLLTYLTENLASKGYVVAAPDHLGSTHADLGDVAISLLHRASDDLALLRQMAAWGGAASGSPFAGIVDANTTALIGYSMGGYGVLHAAGAGWKASGLPDLPLAPEVLAGHTAGNPAYQASLDQRVKAVVALAPWGEGAVFDAGSMAGLRLPSLFIAGDQDRTCPYPGVRRLFEQAIHSQRYLLVFQNGTHQIAANPPPPQAAGWFREYMHYQEPAWDNRRTHNIIQHFTTAFLAQALKGEDYAAYLALEPLSNTTEWQVGEDGRPAPGHSHWHGFPQWTAVGLEWWQGEALP